MLQSWPINLPVIDLPSMMSFAMVINLNETYISDIFIRPLHFYLFFFFIKTRNEIVDWSSLIMGLIDPEEVLLNVIVLYRFLLLKERAYGMH